ncbi:fused signal recognition particle receptor [Halopelagius inordinatus]|uniref:Signal recognition particle receptor FtsY n=1 Tax=Halopelagius inordinatus TaxID=553467 RepID=A0A1I2LFK8_9EURY|nr:signal recognition particle-docking protein FtsY [Halopelagius inordinatus]SFF77813.1 fused signal recognition particle receptor [Halopelagius inordinatus]
MFDGLKKKLQSFRDDVEDTAEEKAEERAEAADDVEEPSPTDAETESEAPGTTDPEPATAADASADAASDVGPAGAEDAAPAEEAAADSEAEDADSEVEVEPNATADASLHADPEPTEEAEKRVPDAADASADAETDDSVPDLEDVAERGSAGRETESRDATDADADADTDTDDAESEEYESIASDAASEALAKDETKKSGAGRLKRAAAFATGKIIIEEEDLEDPLWELEMALLESDVEMTVAEEILDTIREKMLGETRAQVETTGELVSEALHDALYDVISVGQFDFDERVREADKPVTIIFTGVNGVGKTTSIAKMARYFEERGLSTVLANGDTYRAGANEQIRKHADNLGKELITHEQGGDPAAVLYDGVEYAEAHDIDVVLGDTAGRLHTSNDLMSQLEKIDRVVDPDMTLFVDEAVAGQDAVQRSKKFDDAAEIDGTILTKADADSNGGAAISIAYVTGKPILFLGVGQGYGDIERFDPERMVNRLLGREDAE